MTELVDALAAICLHDPKDMRMTEITRGGWLAYGEKLAKFSDGLRSFSRGVESLPACILPNGSRDNDVPVSVAVSTIRKR